MSNINQSSLPAPFYSVRVSISVFKALSTVFHAINSPDNSPLSHVPAGTPSRGGDVAVYVFHTNQPSLATPFYSVLVFYFCLMVLSAVFHS